MIEVTIIFFGSTPKIILPILSLEARYAYDVNDIMVTGGGNGPYYMVRPKADSTLSVKYILAALNHPLSEAFVRKNTSVFRGGYYSHGKQFIENLPIPMPNSNQHAHTVALVDELFGIILQLENMRTPHERLVQERRRDEKKHEIEATINELFGLTTEDINTIQAVPIPE